jgi:hypothetical protein
MPNTPHFKFRLPTWIRKAMEERTDNLSKFIIDAILEKLKKCSPDI